MKLIAGKGLLIPLNHCKIRVQNSFPFPTILTFVLFLSLNKDVHSFKS